jgi:cyclopropane-fatty-acyl-phospholipid synthase
MTQLVSNDIGPSERSEGSISDPKSDLPRSGKVLIALLDKYLKGGQVRFRFGGIEASAGTGDAFETVLRVNDAGLFSRVLRYGNLGLGEAFMDGDFMVEKGELHEFMTACLRAHIDKHVAKDVRLAARLLAFRIHAFLEGSTKSVRRHYDAGDDIFESFLDSSLTYSCGYALSPDDDLETLQRNKMDRICRKLQLEKGNRLLDIGCGFGGLLIFAAREYGARGTGITTSRSHAEGANRQVSEAGLNDRITILLGDFHTVTGEYDRIVSVGMLEHVPRWDHDAYFRCIADHLVPNGLGLVHAIGCNGEGNQHDPFIQKYIFPNSNQPKLSEIARGLERYGLGILDVENIAIHYAYTAHHWLTRFRSGRARLAQRYDESFLRMWEYFFHCAIAGSYASESALFQTLFSADRTARLPLKRI